MSFTLYSVYKDSGAPWLGELPAHWELRRTKFLFNLMKRPPREADGIVTAFRDGEVTLRSNRRVDGFTNALQEVGYQGVRKNDLVIHAMDAFAGAVGVSDSDGKSTPVYSVCTPIKPDTNVWYYSRLLRHMALSGFINSLAKGVRERSTEFRWADAGNTVLPVPTPAEQSAVTAFLDRETGKIDALVTEYERLIDLLKEKRQAVISHAVTKGLDPKVPMKDSGVEWLGEVPAHWDVRPLKRDLAFLTSGSRGWAEHYADDGALFIRIGNLARERTSLDLTDIQRVSPPNGSEGERTRVLAGDVLFSITAYLGSVAVVPEDLEPAYVSQHVALARLRGARMTPSWVGYVTLSRVGKTYLAAQGYGGTKVQLSLEDVANLTMLVPPVPEQVAITAFLDRETGKFDALMAEAEKAIDLLNERRSALISAAVTGKIDVRGLAPTAGGHAE